MNDFNDKKDPELAAVARMTTYSGEEGFSHTLESFRRQLRDESPETTCAVVNALLNDLKEKAKAAIRLKQENIQKELEDINVALEQIESAIQEEEAGAKIDFAADFAKLEQQKLILEGQLALAINERTQDERQQRAILQAKKENLLNQAQELEAEYQNPSSCVNC